MSPTVTANDMPIAVTSFLICDGKIAEMDILADPDRLAELNLQL